MNLCAFQGGGFQEGSQEKDVDLRVALLLCLKMTRT